VFQDAAADSSFGVRLTTQNLTAQIQRVRAERGRWVLENEPAVRIVQQVATDAGYEPAAVMVADGPAGAAR
jgi:hypothetical protein